MSATQQAVELAAQVERVATRDASRRSGLPHAPALGMVLEAAGERRATPRASVAPATAAAAAAVRLCVN